MIRRRQRARRSWVPVFVTAVCSSTACSTDRVTILEAPVTGDETVRPTPGSRDAGTPEADASTTPASAGDAATSPDDAGEPRQEVSLRFAAKIGERDLRCGEAYAAQGSAATRVEPTDLRLFVQDLRLVRSGDGELVPVTLDERLPWQTRDVALLDFEDAQGSCVAGNADTNDLVTGSVPAGTYRGVVFTNGVPEALNHDAPATAPAPLQAGGMSWGWLLGYKFFVAELAQVGDGDAGLPDAGPLGFSLLHLGSTACTGNPGVDEVQCALPNRNSIRLDDFDPATNRIVLDVGALFADTDLRLLSQCHSGGEFCEPLFAGVGLDFADGLPAGAQRVYRVE
jgi:uncharacterized repeat protein (TIGR04052 family)